MLPAGRFYPQRLAFWQTFENVIFKTPQENPAFD
jgi:hypothetical protein